MKKLVSKCLYLHLQELLSKNTVKKLHYCNKCKPKSNLKSSQSTYLEDTLVDVSAPTIEYRDKIGTIYTYSLFFQEISSCRDLKGSLMLARTLHNNLCKLLLFHYMLGSLIWGYVMPLRFSILFLMPLSYHFCIRMHSYGYKFCFIIFVQKYPDL